MAKNLTIAVIIILVLFGGWYFLTNHQNLANAPAGTTGTPSAAGNVTVTYTDSGFSPASVTVKQGQSVTFVDQRSNPMWVASDPHPSHTGYDGTSRSQHCAANYTGATPFDECGSGKSFSFTFNQVGTWGYHDHMDDNMAGTVVVTQ